MEQKLEQIREDIAQTLSQILADWSQALASDKAHNVQFSEVTAALSSAQGSVEQALEDYRLSLSGQSDDFSDEEARAIADVQAAHREAAHGDVVSRKVTRTIEDTIEVETEEIEADMRAKPKLKRTKSKGSAGNVADE